MAQKFLLTLSFNSCKDDTELCMTSTLKLIKSTNDHNHAHATYKEDHSCFLALLFPIPMTTQDILLPLSLHTAMVYYLFIIISLFMLRICDPYSLYSFLISIIIPAQLFFLTLITKEFLLL